MKEAEQDEELRALVNDASELVQHLDDLSPDSLQQLLRELKGQGRKGARLHRPVRLLLTGHPNGAKVSDVLKLLKLAEQEGGNETGPSLDERLELARQLLSKRVSYGLGSSVGRPERHAQADVRVLFGWLEDYVDLPQDFQRSRTRT